MLIGIERFIFGRFSKMPRPVRVFYVQKREAYRSRAGEPGSRPVFKR